MERYRSRAQTLVIRRISSKDVIYSMETIVNDIVYLKVLRIVHKHSHPYTKKELTVR